MTDSTVLTEFKTHCKSRDLKPAQQVKLMLGYLSVHALFPHIALSDFLVASDKFAGATEENRLFPKDALDHWMPTKGSKYTPDERVKFMATYIEYCHLAGPAAMSFDAFLAAMVPPADVATTVTPAAPTTVTPVAPTTPVAPVVPEPPVTPVAPVVPAAPVTPVAPVVPVPAMTFDLLISAADRKKASEYLSLGGAVGGVAVGDTLLSWTVPGHNGLLHVDVINGEPRPSVDIYFEAGGQVVADMPPDTTGTDIVRAYVIRGEGGEFAVDIHV